MLILWMPALLSLTAVAEAKIPHFLFAGQSNMLGYFDPTGNVTARRFDRTMAHLLSTGSDDEILKDLTNHLTTAVSSPPTPISTYEHEAAQLLRYRREGYLTFDFVNPLANVTCSLYQYDSLIDYRVPGTQGITRAVDSALSPYAKCGYIFGPELMCGHVLHDAYSGRPFRIIKVASGGSTLRQNWSRENGFIWPELVKRIRQTIDTDTEEWKAIVWFQGESDSYSNTTAFGYQEDLSTFIADVRNEVFKVDPTTFNQPSDIPVVIVGLGCWVATTTSHGTLVMKAQQDFVASTPNTAFVPTDDLSCDKHYDDASQLMIGARVADALTTLLFTRTILSTREPTVRVIPSLVMAAPCLLSMAQPLITMVLEKGT